MLDYSKWVHHRRKHTIILITWKLPNDDKVQELLSSNENLSQHKTFPHPTTTDFEHLITRNYPNLLSCASPRWMNDWEFFHETKPLAEFRRQTFRPHVFFIRLIEFLHFPRFTYIWRYVNIDDFKMEDAEERLLAIYVEELDSNIYIWNSCTLSQYSAGKEHLM